MSAEWWKAFALFTAGMVVLSFYSEALAIGITLVVGLAAVLLRMKGA